jgi:predicted aspartyl protease
MKLHKLPLLQAIIVMLLYTNVYSLPTAGFFLPDSVKQLTVKFRTLTNLIILPVVINDSVTVNLILDTGCRNIVLFGKKFEKLLTVNKNREVVFSGLGTGNAVAGHLSINNKVSIGSVMGHQVPVVIVPEKNMFSMYKNIHGVIGYDIFLRFEIEINSKTKEITFRPGNWATAPNDYVKIPLRIVDSRPVMYSNIDFGGTEGTAFDLMIDTGSSLGLLLKTKDIKRFEYSNKLSVVGRGLNGLLMGYERLANSLRLNNFEIKDVHASIIESPWHNQASIGMDILKDYIVVLNYCKSYACFKKIAA